MKHLVATVIIFLFYVSVRAQSFSDPNFSVSNIVTGLTEPVGAAFSKDAEKLFVWEKAGLLYVCNKSGSSYVKQTTPVIDLTAEVLNWRDHGLMGFALDPNFATNGYIYLLYIVDRRFLMNNTSIVADAGHQATIARLTKYRTITSGSNLIADLSTRTILIGESPSTGIPVVHESHVIGCLAFAADGTLLVSTGDGASYYVMDAGSDSDTYWDQAIQDGILRPAENVGAFRSQILNCHNGKLLRIDPNTGDGIPSNPFYSAAQPRAPKSRVWAMGFRNAFRMLVKPGTGSTNPATGDIGEVYVGDVGWSTWEEFSIITGPGMNCGWPIYEGHEINSQYNTRAATLQNLDEPNPLSGQSGCTRPNFTFRELIKDPTRDENKTINNPCNSSVAIGTGNRYVHRRPAIDFRHEVESSRVGIFNGNNPAVAEIGTPQSGVVGTPFAGNCALAGVWYTGNNFPPEYKNTFLLVDETAKWIKRFTTDYTDVVTRVDNLVMVFANITTLAENPVDGTLAAVDITNNAVKKIQYGGNQPPVSVPKANVTYGPSPLTVNFTGNTSFDLSPGGSIASYSWNFGGGTPATSNVANPTGIVFTNTPGVPKKFVVKLTVTDNGGATDVDSVIISVNNTPPVVNITSPVKNSTYPLGGDAVYNCTATVTDNEHSGSGLFYEWQTILRHNNHEHPEPIDNNVTTTTLISRIGCNGDTYYWMVRLKVTDAAGLSGVDSSKIFPDCGSDNIPPIITSTTPINGATGVNVGSTISANFSEAIAAASVTATTFLLKDAGNNTVAASLSTNNSQITLTPLSALSGSTVYTATVKGGTSGVKDLVGNTLANDFTWSFTTSTVDNIAPTITSVIPVNGATGVSTGTTVTANFSEAINSSTVTGSTVQLRNPSNTLITATLNVSGSQVTLTPSAALAASTVYTVTILGGTSGVKDLAGNALASNYVWSFTTGAIDNIAPTVSTVSPANGATSISTGTNVTATFSEGINASTVTTSTFQLRNAANTLITATVSTSGNQITLTPSAQLANSVVYTATITGGASGVKDLAGNALASNYSWSFTTAAASSTTYTIWPVTATPAEPFNSDGQGIAVGVKFRTTQSGFINGIRYYKGAGTTGTHTGHLWTSTGTIMGSITFTGETASGWQQALFATPVAINANTTYVASIFSPSGHYAATDPYFTTAVVNGPLRALANGEDGPNGLYRYTSTNAFPNSSFNASNYWVDVVFATGSTAVAPSVTTHPASQTRCAGANASFTSAASGTPSPTVQWQSGTGTTWTNITGATNATLTFAVTTADNNKQYRAVWTNSAGTVNSNAATLTVNPIPVLSSSLTGSATSGTLFSYTATSSTSGTSFAWSRAAVSGVSNATASGTGNVSETLVNTTSSPVNVTYVYTLTAAGCANTQNVVVTVSAGIVTVSPSVTTQPSSQAKCSGQNASFTSAASGTPTPTVQWQSSTGTTWANITGATNATLTFAVTTADNSKQYRAVWTNSAGSVNSNAAVLTVNPVPTLSSSLTASATSGNLFTYTATSSTSGTTFAWSRSVVTGISNAANNGTGNISETLVNTIASPVNVTYIYTLNASGCSNSQNLVVTVNPSAVTAPPTMTIQPVAQTKCAGQNVSFTSSANGIPSPTVQWQSSTDGTIWTNITGATNATLTFAVTTADNNKQYQAVWSNSEGTINSDAALLTVNPIPVLSSSLTASATTGTIFNYNAASLTPATTFAWTRAVVTGISNSAGSGTGDISETLVNTTASPVNVTYVYTLNAAGCVNTQNVVVTVNPDGSIVSPAVTTQPAAQTKCASQSVTFTSSASGAPAPTVQWQSNTSGTWTNMSGATNGTLTFAATIADNNKQYRAVWSNSAGSVNSNAALLTVNAIPVLSSNLSATATSGTAFTYTATSTISGTTFEWSRAAVTGISNAATTGTGNVSETLVNTTSSPITVTYVYTLTASGCTNTQNVVVTVNPVSVVNCVINGSIVSSFNSSSIPAGRYIWFSSVLDRGSFGGITGTVTFTITNATITFTANSQLYTLNVPNSRIRFDAAVTSASTQFLNGNWETTVPRGYTGYVFMGGLAYQVPASLPGNISNVRWTATISIDKANVRPTWKWAAAVYTSFATHTGLNIKPKNGSTQNPYPNNDNAGTPENFKSSLVSGAKGTGGTNYTGTYSSTSTATCTTGPGQRPTQEPLITKQFLPKKVTSLPIDRLDNEELSVSAVPNPSNNVFRLIIKGDNKSYVSVKVTDVFGRVVEHYQKVSANTILQIGQRLSGGSYFVEVIQGDKRRFLKIIKSN